jgi:hypothetical protein
MLRFFQPGAGRFGTHPVFIQNAFGTITANTTNTLNLGQVHRLAVIARIAVSVLTVPADSDGTVLLTIKKYDASANAAVTLTAAFDMEAIAAAKESEEIALLSSLTDDELLFAEGDTLYAELVSNSAAFNTAPAGVVVSAEFLLRK